MTVKKDYGCCIEGYTYVLPYEWVVCADHEEIAATWKPDATWIAYFKNNQGVDWNDPNELRPALLWKDAFEIREEIRAIFLNHIHDPAWFTLMQAPIENLFAKRDEELKAKDERIKKLDALTDALIADNKAKDATIKVLGDALKKINRYCHGDAIVYARLALSLIQDEKKI